MNPKDSNIGIIGLGDMGGGIAANLIRAGLHVIGFDLKEAEMQRFASAGGQLATDSEEIVRRCTYVLTCVEGQASIALADQVLLPRARPGQTFIDHSTVPAPETRRIGAAYLAKGCRYLDAPVSGGRQGAEAGTLRIFVGGDEATARECWPLFEAAGNAEKIAHYGPIGMGQVAKVVQQLTVRFPDVARMEVMAFGLRAGLNLDDLMRALDVDPQSGDSYARLYRDIRDGKTDHLSGLYSEWHYFLAEAHAQGFSMPMLEAMYEFCKDAAKVNLDPLERPEPSIWNELMRR